MRHVIPILMWVVACGGEPEVEPVLDPEPPSADAGQAEEETLEVPVLECKDGAAQAYQATAEGHEHFCIKDGAKHGPYTRLHPNGSRAVEGRYVYGEPDGAWSWYHPTGEKAKKGSYRKGREMGTWQTWSVSGEVEELGDYLNGRKTGQWTRYHESGRKAYDGMYLNDMKHGTWSYFLDEDGSPLERTETWQTDQLTATRTAKGAQKR